MYPYFHGSPATFIGLAIVFDFFKNNRTARDSRRPVGDISDEAPERYFLSA